MLGIDPGLTRCGFAVVDGRGRGRAVAISLGVITTPRTDPLPQRLGALRTEFTALIAEFAPDVVAVEQSGGYAGRYFVLMGHLSPLDGIGPEQLGLDRLEALLDEGEVREVILATNPTVEGEATAHFIGEMVTRRGIRATRIAHGVPVGGELEYVDGGTLAHALAGRQLIA